MLGTSMQEALPLPSRNLGSDLGDREKQRFHCPLAFHSRLWREKGACAVRGTEEGRREGGSPKGFQDQVTCWKWGCISSVGNPWGKDVEILVHSLAHSLFHFMHSVHEHLPRARQSTGCWLHHSGQIRSCRCPEGGQA